MNVLFYALIAVLVLVAGWCVFCWFALDDYRAPERRED